jgi:hypothetical protein
MSEYAYPSGNYGAMARTYWQQHLPQRYAAIEDPDGFFDKLGAEVTREIGELSGQMTAEAPNPPGEDFLERVGRLNAVRKQAEEIVLADRVFLPPETGAGDGDDFAEADG